MCTPEGEPLPQPMLGPGFLWCKSQDHPTIDKSIISNLQLPKLNSVLDKKTHPSDQDKWTLLWNSNRYLPCISCKHFFIGQHRIIKIYCPYLNDATGGGGGKKGKGIFSPCLPLPLGPLSAGHPLPGGCFWLAKALLCFLIQDDSRKTNIQHSH